jgi:hypothetical protein
MRRNSEKESARCRSPKIFHALAPPVGAVNDGLSLPPLVCLIRVSLASKRWKEGEATEYVQYVPVAEHLLSKSTTSIKVGR